MKYSRYVRLLSAAVCGGVLMWCATAHAGSTEAAAKPAAMDVPKSVFVDEANKGKDPFFPESNRRIQVIPITPSTTNAVSDMSALFSLLQLKGISGPRDRRLAIINSATLGVGETADIRCAGRQLKVRCREIRESSVVVELVGLGETRELRLRQNI